MVEMKTCSRAACRGQKPATPEFFSRNKALRDGLANWCKVCEAAGKAEYSKRPDVIERRREGERRRRATNPRPKDQVKRQQLWTWYRITPERFAEMLEAQGGKCAIKACPNTEPGGHGTWHVDHDHSCCDKPRSCGKCVRGLLCVRCNLMLGYSRDSVEIMASSIEYLQNFNALQSALGPIGG